MSNSTMRRDTVLHFSFCQCYNKKYSTVISTGKRFYKKKQDTCDLNSSAVDHNFCATQDTHRYSLKALLSLTLHCASRNISLFIPLLLYITWHYFL